jgi:hypothetical protein
VRGEIELRGEGSEEIDAAWLIAPAERALRLLTAATVLLTVALVAARL